MAGDGHDGEVVVAGEAQIVYGAVAQVVEGKVTQSCLLHSTAPLEFVIPCKILDRLSLAQKNSVSVKFTGQIAEHFQNQRMNRDPSLKTILGICARQPYEEQSQASFFQKARTMNRFFKNVKTRKALEEQYAPQAT